MTTSLKKRSPRKRRSGPTSGPSGEASKPTNSESKKSRRPPTSAFDRIAKLLGRRDHSERELREKLRRAQHLAEEIETALQEVRALKWLPDEATLAEREAGRLARQGKSPQQIRIWLARKGLPTSPVQTMLADREEESAYKTALKAWAQQCRLAERQLDRNQARQREDQTPVDEWSRGDFHPLERTLRDRMLRLLISRGFSSRTAQAVFARLLAENPLNLRT